MKPSVFVENNDHTVQEMFLNRGWVIKPNAFAADIVCFTGGADVMPALYGHSLHPFTKYDPTRDQNCVDLFNLVPDEKPLVGICRGAQFLNVMCGGWLYQHVDNHALVPPTTHLATDVQTKETYMVTSTHHQMMIPSYDAEIILTATESKKKILNGFVSIDNLENMNDSEVLWYEDDKCLCFQPHPEYVDKEHKCQELFFTLIDQYIINN